MPVAPDNCQAVSNWVSGAPQVVTWALIVLGWWLVDRRSHRQDFRRETRALMDQLRKDMDALSEKAISYYVSENSDESKKTEMEIKVSIGRVVYAAGFIGQRLDIDMTEHLSQLMGSVTGRDFESSGRVKLAYDDECLLDIALKTKNVLEKIDQGFAARYVENPLALGSWWKCRTKGLRS